MKQPIYTSALYDGVREAVINSVTYSDFQTEGVLRIDRRDDEIIIRNPGLLRISAERIYNGDFTHARNRNIQKMFRMIGYGDNIGSGFQKILAAWNTLGFLRPDLKELEDVKEVWLTLPLVEIGKEDVGISKVEEAAAKYVSTVNTVENPGQRQVKGQANRGQGQMNSDLGQIKRQIENAAGLSGLQKEVLLYLLSKPSATVKECAEVFDLSSKSIRYAMNKVGTWLKIKHLGSKKIGMWSFELVNNEESHQR